MNDWRSILAEHGPSIWRTVYRLLDHHADASDCYQETILAAWQVGERQPINDWASFLTILATRRAVDRLRQRYRSRRRVAPLDGVQEPACDGTGPLLQAQATELMDRVREEMAHLPDKQAEVFWLSAVEGFAAEQIADRMRIPPGEVRVLLHRARVRLRTVLESQRRHERTDDERQSATHTGRT